MQAIRAAQRLVWYGDTRQGLGWLYGAGMRQRKGPHSFRECGPVVTSL